MAKEKKTKERVLELLESRNTTFISGQEIADTLFITRAGIWKAVKSLRESGINIEAVSNRGYRLVKDKDILSKDYIDKELREENLDIETVILGEVESTNDVARQYAHKDRRDYAIISDYQTKGHGRRGRVFFSPKGTGIYMSMLIHPKMDVSRATGITCMGAVAVCRAIEKLTDMKPSIKWVNDIFLDDKKICGILTEGYTSIEDGGLEFLIVGIGINLYPPRDGFPDEIKKIAGVLFPQGQNEENVKNRLCSLIIREFFNLYEKNDYIQYIDEYRNRSNLIGHYVKMISSEGKASKDYCKVLGIDEDFHLIVQHENGSREALSTGEVSVIKY